MKKKMKQIWIGFGVVALLGMLCCMPLAADAARSERKPSAVDVEEYADFMASKPLDIKDLVNEAEAQRRFFDRITPPNVPLLQPMMPSVLPFDDTDFTDAFLDDLLGEDKNSVAVYPLSLSLDPKTRKTLIYNADGKLIASLPATKGSRTEAKESDPSRVTLLLDLLPSEDVEPYLYTESRIEESLVSEKSRTAKSGGMAMKSLGSTEFGIARIQKLASGNMRVTVSNGTDFAELFAYTVVHTSTVSGSNTFWSPVSPGYNGVEEPWVCLTTNLVFTNGVTTWDDENIPEEARIRFYAVARRTDTDSDDLTDGSEFFIHHTDPGMADTDGDEMPDGWEVQYSLDPQDPADAEEDPDNDHLVNREEYELGLGINTSNEVVMVYFNANPTPPLRGSGGESGYIYLSAANLQSKAIKSVFEKDGYPEFSNDDIPPSDPPKYYLNISLSETYKQNSYHLTASWLETYGYSNYWFTGRTFLPQETNGYISFIDTRTSCSGYGTRMRYSESFYQCQDIHETESSYSYDQPQTNDLLWVEEIREVNQQCVPNHYVVTNQYSVSTYLDFSLPASNACTHTHSENTVYSSNSIIDGRSTNIWEEEIFWAIDLTSEYTDNLLFYYAQDDLMRMSIVTNLNWGECWINGNHQTSRTNDLSSASKYTAYLISSNHTELILQELTYRWAIPTETNIHYKLIWLEAFRPQGSDTFTWYDLKNDVFTGDGNIYTSETHQAKFPWEMELPGGETNEPYGTVEPIGFIVDITEPKGLPLVSGLTANDIFRGNPYCFKWQYIYEDNVLIPYDQDIEGLVQPTDSMIGYHWSVTDGTLTDDDTAMPSYKADNMTEPQTMTTVELVLCPMADCNVCYANRTLEVYRDHLERDFQNFGSDISCGDVVLNTPWQFTRYGGTITMPQTWNCFGSTWHAYDGSHSGQATDVPTSGFTVSTYTDPINWSTALAGLERGDIVVFFNDNDIQHAHTCLSDASEMYGANNRPGMNIITSGSGATFFGAFTGSWKWDVTTSQQYYDKLNADHSAFFTSSSGPFLNKIKVYRR